MTHATTAHAMLTEIWQALDGPAATLSAVQLSGQGALPSVFATSDLAQASVAAAGLALAELVQAGGAPLPQVVCERRLASLWFSASLRPQGWQAPSLWDAVAGDYRTADGWIRLHTNAAHHRVAALEVLGLDPQQASRADVAGEVARWTGSELETAIVAHGGCAAQMRSQADWSAHPQGAAVAAEPLVARQVFAAPTRPRHPVDPARPLAGVRVLDLTRVLAGPTATRFLAGFGADVLRIDPASWNEPGVVPEMTLGKRCAQLELDRPEDRATLETLLAQADVMVHGYRSDALEHLGLGAQRRRALNPALVDVALDAYGWSGPWAGRRGFDSLVQMSSGIADFGMKQKGGDQPVPLPVQALDHATGYLLAASALRGLALRQQSGQGSQYRLSLARTARLLADYPAPLAQPALVAETAEDLDPRIEHTAWGPAQRLRSPLQVAGSPMYWDRPASPLRSLPARWD
ncbi:CoA transferase [Herbaspirillum rubrisubalbicans Os34]|uniref:CoA transferase n=1 Tax=Herbaspirillum rubrisubalbicans Os34 TaxID=1235827 RepID=A0A6M3ZSL2_9BURK|nr:CoA transferase [Herbaspirillum rubrisubalbicans]QJQ00970.1 CoA transferase [Herbaspirillum rubrisubalbicans Os34]